jgi:hypothetical protein
MQIFFFAQCVFLGNVILVKQLFGLHVKEGICWKDDTAQNKIRTII